MDFPWRKGCGAGCAVLLLLVVALAGGGLWFAGRMNADFKAVRASEESLAADHGFPAAWAPADLLPDSTSVARFMEVRRDLSEWRIRLATHMTQLAALDTAEGNPVTLFIHRLRAGGELATLYAGFWTARNAALQEAGLGGGQYIWLYHLVYTAWLDHAPDEGADKGNWYRGPKTGDGDPGAEGRASLRDLRRQRVERQLRSAQLTDPDQQRWRDAELARLAADPERLPWTTELPSAMAAGLEPFSAELVALWDPVTNPVELIFEFEAASAP